MYDQLQSLLSPLNNNDDRDKKTRMKSFIYVDMNSCSCVYWSPACSLEPLNCHDGHDYRDNDGDDDDDNDDDKTNRLDNMS